MSQMKNALYSILDAINSCLNIHGDINYEQVCSHLSIPEINMLDRSFNQFIVENPDGDFDDFCYMLINEYQ